MEQELFVYPFGAPGLDPVLSRLRDVQSLHFCEVFYRALFVFASFFFSHLNCLFFADFTIYGFRKIVRSSVILLLPLITNLESSSFSLYRDLIRSCPLRLAFRSIQTMHGCKEGNKLGRHEIKQLFKDQDAYTSFEKVSPQYKHCRHHRVLVGSYLKGHLQQPISFWRL